MNPRQRQGLILVLIAAAGLLGVFVLIANYVSSVSRQVGDKISVVTLISRLQPYQPVEPNMLGEVSLPQKWAPSNAITDPSSVVGLISPIGLSANTRLQQGMLVAAPQLTAGRRAVPIPITAANGGTLGLQPGDLVDVVASYQGSGSSDAHGPGSRDRSEVVIASAMVLSAPQPPQSGASTVLGNASVPVTLSLTPQQQVQLTYAESFAAKYTLTKVGPRSAPVTPPPYSPTQ